MASVHLVQQGECLADTERYGFSNYHQIFEHPQNAELRRRRTDPNILYPGDLLFIPDPEVKEVEVATGRLHEFVRKRQRVLLRVRVVDEDGHPYANKKYVLLLDGERHEGATNGQALVERRILANASRATLKVWFDENAQDEESGYAFDLDLGCLDPVEEIEGVQGRLCNLGFYLGEIDGVLGEATREALRAFQARSGLDQTGEPDEATRLRLEQEHDHD